MARLRADGFGDVWAALQPGQAGHTGTWNNGKGIPVHNLYKRIDYVLIRGAAGVAIRRFAHDLVPGGCVPSDHAGLVATIEGRP